MTDANSDKVRAIPEGYHAVTPWIISRDSAGLIAFLEAAFGAVEIARVQDDNGAIGYAEVRIGDSVVMMFDAKPDWPETPAFIHLYVEDGDAVFHQALQAGATPVTEMTHLFWGDRVGRVRDPFGNLWWIQTRIENASEEEMEWRMGENAYIEEMRVAVETLDRDLSGRTRT